MNAQEIIEIENGLRKAFKAMEDAKQYVVAIMRRGIMQLLCMESARDIIESADSLAFAYHMVLHHENFVAESERDGEDPIAVQLVVDTFDLAQCRFTAMDQLRQVVLQKNGIDDSELSFVDATYKFGELVGAEVHFLNGNEFKFSWGDAFTVSEAE